MAHLQFLGRGRRKKLQKFAASGHTMQDTTRSEASEALKDILDQLPEELQQKLLKESKKCDGCNLPFFGRPTVTCRVPGVVGKERVWLDVQYCSLKCAKHLHSLNQ